MGSFFKTTDEFIGRAGFSVMDTGEVEVGYGFLLEHWGKGYATETLDALLKWAFANVDKPEILAFTHIDNIASKKVIEKCGMQFINEKQVIVLQIVQVSYAIFIIKGGMV